MSEPVKTIPVRNNQYNVFNIDLSVARDNVPLELKDFLRSRNVEFATFMVIINVPAPWSFRVNRGNASLCTAMVGDEWQDFEITEIFITNPVGLGFAQIHIEWRTP